MRCPTLGRRWLCDLYSSRFLFGVSGLVFVCRLLVSVQLCSCGRGNIVMLDGVDLPARDESVGEHTHTHTYRPHMDRAHDILFLRPMSHSEREKRNNSRLTDAHTDTPRYTIVAPASTTRSKVEHSPSNLTIFIAATGPPPNFPSINRICLRGGFLSTTKSACQLLSAAELHRGVRLRSAAPTSAGRRYTSSNTLSPSRLHFAT